MSRGKKNPNAHRQITVYVEDDVAQHIDLLQNSFGLDTRASAALVLMKAGMSAIPVDTAIFEVCRQSVIAARKHTFNAMYEFFQSQAEIYKPR